MLQSPKPELIIVGNGVHAREVLVPAIASLGRARIVGFCDLDVTLARSLANRYDVGNAGTVAKEMIDELSPTAVVLAGSPFMHVEVGTYALEAGCHVLVEKPPALSVRGLARLADAAKTSGKIGMVAHNLRYTAAWRRATERISFNDLTSMSIAYHASGPTGERWGLMPHESFLLSHAIHAFDLLNAALGPAVSTRHHVKDAGQGRFALTSQWHSPEDVLGAAVVSTCAPRFDWTVQFTTATPSLVNLYSPSSVVLHGPRTQDAWGSGQRDAWLTRSLESGYESAGYGAEIIHFLDCIEGIVLPMPSFADELAVYRALDSVYEQSGLLRSDSYEY